MGGAVGKCCCSRLTAPQRLLSFLLVGGGPTSIEFAGELNDFIEQDAKCLYPELVPRCQVTLLEASNEILGAFQISLASYARRLLKKRHVEVLTGARVTGVEDGVVNVVIDGNPRKIAFGVCLWSTGVTATPFVKALPFANDDGWRVKVDPFLRCVAKDGETVVDNVYAIGDCAGTHLVSCVSFVLVAALTSWQPATAQAANQEALYLARRFNGVASAVSKPFEYNHVFTLAYIGGYKALLDGGGHRRLSGVLAFLMWRTAYWTSSVSWSNKLLIPMHWFKSFMFGRDTSKF